MGLQFGLGSIVGLVVGLLSWRGNQTAHLVSTFPVVLTFAALAALLAVVIRFVVRRQQLRGRSASLRAGVRVATAAGVVFGAAVVGLGFLRYTNPAAVLLAYGFFTAFGSALVLGVFAALTGVGFPRERAA